MLLSATKRRQLVVLLAVLSVVALVLVGRRLNATKIGGSSLPNRSVSPATSTTSARATSRPFSSPGPRATSCSTAAIRPPRG